MEIVEDVPIAQLWEIIMQGKLMLPSVQTAVQAIDRLAKLKLLKENRGIPFHNAAVVQ